MQRIINNAGIRDTLCCTFLYPIVIESIGCTGFDDLNRRPSRV